MLDRRRRRRVTDPRIATLRAELRDDTAFVATPTPRLSWTGESDEPGWLQASAELSDGFETTSLEGRESVLVAWPFAPLTPGESRDVTVRVRSTAGGDTGVSSPLRV